VRALAPPFALVLTLSGCRRGDEERLNPRRLAEVAAPSSDPDGLCSDLGVYRVCWAAACPAGVCVRPRPIPSAIEPHALGYRCTGAGSARECAPRAERAPAFQCRGARCSQEQPRLPDDGEWECSDLSGVVLCRGGNEPAAVVHVSVDPGWLCGSRRGAKGGERVCLDLDPDLPEKANLRACRFEIDGARSRRLCERSEKPLLGDACSHSDLCPPGSECEAGICLLPRPFPSCWGDADCKLGQCWFGTCSTGAQ
jgi:hypothetical protein